jgi:hypothetical protein
VAACLPVLGLSVAEAAKGMGITWQQLHNMIAARRCGKMRGQIFILDSAAKPIWWKNHYQKGHQNTLAENKNGL